MKLSKQQSLFTSDISKLITFANIRGHDLAFREVQRTQEQADLYAKQGKGIHNSLHLKCLAADFALYKDGTYLVKHSDYQFLGDYWESLSPLNRWGGNFTKHGGKIDDADHFQRNPEQE